LNVNGYYDFLLKQLDVMVEQKFMKPTNRELVITSGDPIELINLMDGFKVTTDEVWFKDSNLT
jgi:predicted Rossmann-fold nucleotide-binding protein